MIEKILTHHSKNVEKNMQIEICKLKNNKLTNIIFEFKFDNSVSVEGIIK